MHRPARARGIYRIAYRWRAAAGYPRPRAPAPPLPRRPPPAAGATAQPVMMISGMLLLTLLQMLAAANSCSTIVAGPKATKDGSTFASHSNDGGGSTDGRLVSVPARDYPEGTLRPIYYATEDYPRYVGPDLGPSYMSTWPGGAAGYNDSVPIGHIPQVPVSHCG